MKNWRFNRINRSTFEKSGPIPRSITRTIEKFKKELDPNSDNDIIEEFKISKYQTIASLKYLLILLLIPVIFNQISKVFVFGPIVDHFWNINQPDIFLNSSQEERAFAELQRFEEKIHFQMLIEKSIRFSYETIEQKVKNKAIDIAEHYSNESANAIKNILSDSVSVAFFVALLISSKKQISVLKSFLNELIYGLSDTAKAFLIILFTDMFIGFHSPHGWEVIIESLLRHFGLPENRDFIFLFIATFPVALDTIFKYWIFRYLNRVSPSAVATYHNMNE
uniref:Envelope membrane protein n=1 Tax=Cyanidium sp. THAL103 TaxID=3027999 RepID=A0A9Y1I415_9RHOD|nr:envelope membrane protein [Cyanidium sp. THAL103]